MADATRPTADIAVVIPTLGRADALKVCLESLAAQTTLPAETIVVHSGADPETVAVCGLDWQAQGLAVRYYAYPRRSAALQRDYAVRRTTRPLIMFADDDMEFEPRWIESLLAELMRSPEIGAVMGRILNHTIAMPTPLWRLYRRLVAGPSRGLEPGAVIGAQVQNGFAEDATAPVPAEWIGGCNTLLRRDVYLALNGFAPHFRGSSPGEDVELGFRISRRWKVFYVPSARCLHHQSPLGRESINEQQYLSTRSRYAFCRSNAAMGAVRALWHVTLWATFQTASEFGQVRHGRLRVNFLSGCWGRIRGLWSCVGWNPAAERFPDWHDLHGN